MKKPGILFISLLCAVMFLMSCEKTIVTDTTPPAPVTELKAVSENGKIVLTWKDPSDSDLLGIKIYNGKEQARAVSLSDGVLVGKGIQKYEVTGLENEKIYTFKVSAVDKALNESKTVESGKITFIEKLVKTVYVCPNCEKTYGTAKEAADCCGVRIVEKKVTHYAFVCPKCKEEYLSPQKAADCCGIQIEYVDREVEKIVKKYLCPRDGKEYDKAEEAENCCGPVEIELINYTKVTAEVGDIVLSNGKFVSPDFFSSYAGSAIPVGVVCKVNADCKRGLMLGLYNSSSGINSGYKQWAPSNTIGYSKNFTEIQGTTTSGIIDGSNTWNEICKVDQGGTEDSVTNYPAFNYVLSYAETAGINETSYNEGWYLPTVYELYNYIYQNKVILNDSLTVTGGTKLANYYYWSSSQNADNSNCAWYISFSIGTVYYTNKESDMYICCLRSFGEDSSVTPGDYTKEIAEIGDITLSNGKFISPDCFSFYSGTAIPVGVICKVNKDGKTGLMVGLCNSSAGINSGIKKWGPRNMWGNSNAGIMKAIQGTKTDGDIDGSNNWEEICKVETKYTEDPATYYPAFNYALIYGETAGLAETEYASGWYMPALFELFNYIYLNKTTINESLSASGGVTLIDDGYWSSSRSSGYDRDTWYINLADGKVAESYEYYGGYICCLRAF